MTQQATQTLGAIPTARGCGSRKKGGVYAEAGLSPRGQPLENFLIDPTRPIDSASYGLSPINQVLITDSNGCVHVLDWIGESYYRNTTDWLEEVRRFGMSQRLELHSSAYAQLTHESTLLPVHPYAHVEDKEQIEYMLSTRVDMQLAGYRWSYCPKSGYLNATTHPKEYCAGYLWMTTVGGKSLGDEFVEIEMPSFKYKAVQALREYDYIPGLFAAMPIHRLAIVRDTEGGVHEKKAKMLVDSGTTLPFDIVED